MDRYLLDALYALGLLAVSPIVLYRRLRHGRYREGWGQKFGASPVRYGLQPAIWIHGVSLGEVNAARTLVAELHRQLPDMRVVISSSTDTGITAARRLFAPDHEVFHWPLDFSWSVARSLDRVRPAMVVMMEGEVWPNFLAACQRREIPTLVVNGRLSADKGYPRYRRLGRLAASLFNRLSAIGAQTEDYAQRYLALGVEPDKVHVTGMLKYDTAAPSDRVAGQDELAAALGLTGDAPLVVAGGTGDGEEAIVLSAFDELRKQHGGLRLAVVPRKPERFDEVARLIESTGHKLLRRSGRPDGSTGSADGEAVILGDTMGELRKFYALATVVFVGRSLVPMGGSDMIESAALARPTVFGPHTFNFPQAEDLARNGCEQVPDAAGLVRQLDAWLSDPSAAAEAGKRAQQFVRGQQGATLRNVELICRLLGRRPAIAEGGIATDQVTVAE